MSAQVEEDALLLAFFLAKESLIDSRPDGVGTSGAGMIASVLANTMAASKTVNCR